MTISYDIPQNEKLKDPFDVPSVQSVPTVHPSHPQIKHFQRKKGQRNIVILKESHTFPTPNKVKVKTIGPQLDMPCISLRGVKYFHRFKKVAPRYMFRKCHIRFLDNNRNISKNNRTPTGYALHLPSGDKTFSWFQKGRLSVVF